MADENTSNEELVIKDNEGKETTFKVADVETLISKNSELTGKLAGAEDFNKVLERYGTDQETYLNNAEAAFGVMSELIEQGLIDDKGNVVEKKQEKDQNSDLKSNQNSDALDFEKMFGFSSEGDKGGSSGNEKTLQIISKVVDTKLGGLVKQVKELSSGQAGLYRAQLKTAVQAKHTAFSDNDVSRLFGIASANPGKDLWAHAEEMAKEKKTSSDSDRERFAKEFGVNLQEFDANKLNEQDSKGGGTISALKGKRFVFPRRAKRLGAKDTVSPREALALHLKAVSNR